MLYMEGQTYETDLARVAGQPGINGVAVPEFDSVLGNLEADDRESIR